MRIPPPEAETQVGVNFYATNTPPCNAILRASEDDFRVTELIDPGGIRKEDGPGFIPLYRVEKRGIDTLHLARELSKALKSRVAYGGMKDKRALAVQYFSPTSARSETPREVVGQRFRAELVGYVPRPFTRRMVLGNHFEIILRDTCVHVAKSVEEAYEVCRARRIPNFFGLQRFGARDPITHRVGSALVRGDFEEAISEFLSTPRKGEGPETRAAREMVASGRYREALGLFGRGQDLEGMALERLLGKRDDFIGALRAIPIAVRRLFVHAYQSYLFNRVLSKACVGGVDISFAVAGDNWSNLSPDGLTLREIHGAKETPRQGALPLIQLVGYAYRDYGSRFDRFVLEVLKEEGIEPRQFFLKGAQELSVEGGFRRAPLIAKELGFSSGEVAVNLSFSLAKGEYATTLLREVAKPMDPISSGFGS